MTRAVIDIDDGPLGEASRALGTSTKKETVDAALKEVLETRRRVIALTRLRGMVADGAVDASLFEDKGSYRR